MFAFHFYLYILNLYILNVIKREYAFNKRYKGDEIKKS